jgi:ABC-type phosphate transport system substrate-binding protein
MKERTPSPSATNILRRFCHCRSLMHIWPLCFLALGLYSAPAVGQHAVVLVGSGSTVPAPLYNRWAPEYGKHRPNIQVRYLPVGMQKRDVA